MSRKTGIVCCGILKEELELICQQENIEAQRYYINPALHVDFDMLEEELVKTLKTASKEEEEIVVIFGSCHPEIDEIIAKYNAERLLVKDCITALIGDRQKELNQEANNFYLTSGWLKNWREIFIEGLGWDDVDARQNFGFYDRILLVDTGIREISDREILEFFEYTEVSIETLEADLSHFRDLVSNKLTT